LEEEKGIFLVDTPRPPAPPPLPPSAPLVIRPPWLDGANAPSTELAASRAHLRRHLEDLLDKTMAEGEAGQNDRRFIERLLQRVERNQLDLPPFPDIARELDALLRQPATDILQIAKVVERDPGLIKRVWTHARSAMYSSAPRSLHHAVARVGLDTLWQIGMSVCLNDNVFRVEGFQDIADEMRFHGLATAEVAAGISGERRGSLYLAGLLHDVGGLLILRTASSKGVDQLPQRALVRLVVEQQHTAFGVMIVDAWKLDETVAAGMAWHHDPSKAPPQARHAAQVVNAAHIAAHAIGITRKVDAPNILEAARADIARQGFDAEEAFAIARHIYAELDHQEAPPPEATEPPP
jgi:HD-like signal output (HDOD) protein